jgi:hypothetical protein
MDGRTATGITPRAGSAASTRIGPCKVRGARQPHAQFSRRRGGDALVPAYTTVIQPTGAHKARFAPRRRDRTARLEKGDQVARSTAQRSARMPRKGIHEKH